MGLLKHLLFWPVTGPGELVKFSLRQVDRTVIREVTDDEGIREELMELNLLADLGEIGDEEYLEREAELMERLRATRRWRERLGMEAAWAPLGTADADEDSGG